MAPRYSWPSPPTLKMPTRAPKAQARPVRHRTMVYSRVLPNCRLVKAAVKNSPDALTARSAPQKSAISRARVVPRQGHNSRPHSQGKPHGQAQGSQVAPPGLLCFNHGSSPPLSGAGHIVAQLLFGNGIGPELAGDLPLIQGDDPVRKAKHLVQVCRAQQNGAALLPLVHNMPVNELGGPDVHPPGWAEK